MKMIASALLVLAAALAAQAPDLILVNGKIVTLDDKHPEAQALAAAGGKITAVGTDAEIRRIAGSSTKIVDLKGALAVPGLIEGHGHFTSVGQSLMVLDLRTAHSWDDIVAQVGEAVRKAKPGDWILGRGWHQEKWDKPPAPNIHGFPVHDALSKVSPANPVALTHASGHAVFVNAAAMKAAGITRDTKDPDGGEVARDANGNPTGLLNERAQGLISAARAAAENKQTPAEREARARREIELAAQDALSKGLTTFQDAGSPFATIDLMRKMAAEGRIGIRLWVMMRDSTTLTERNIARYRIIGEANDFLTVRAVKRQIDGALGSRGAWLLEPYSDQPDTSGKLTENLDDMRRVAKLCIENNVQFCVHAIGDRANRETLNLFEEEFREHPEKKDLRWRVEHAQHLSLSDIPRFGKLGVIASMQAIHCTSDAPYVIARLGTKRAEEGAYVWRKLIDSGAIVTNGTDAPVEDENPVPNFYAAVTRRTRDGSEFFPAQRMTRMEALRSYTILNAYSAFEEKIKGSLEVGKLADVTVLDRDILTVPEAQLPGARVLYTMVGGKVAYQAK
jgi:predicted amidohydrolase YtcJ